MEAYIIHILVMRSSFIKLIGVRGLVEYINSLLRTQHCVSKAAYNTSHNWTQADLEGPSVVVMKEAVGQNLCFYNWSSNCGSELCIYATDFITGTTPVGDFASVGQDKEEPCRWKARGSKTKILLCFVPETASLRFLTMNLRSR